MPYEGSQGMPYGAGRYDTGYWCCSEWSSSWRPGGVPRALSVTRRTYMGNWTNPTPWSQQLREPREWLCWPNTSTRWQTADCVNSISAACQRVTSLCCFSCLGSAAPQPWFGTLGRSFCREKGLHSRARPGKAEPEMEGGLLRWGPGEEHRCEKV